MITNMTTWLSNHIYIKFLFIFYLLYFRVSWTCARTTNMDSSTISEGTTSGRGARKIIVLISGGGIS